MAKAIFGNQPNEPSPPIPTLPHTSRTPLPPSYPPMPPPEVVHEPIQPTTLPDPRPPPPSLPISSGKIYFITQVFAIFLTILCPRTKLWRLRAYDPKIPADDDIINTEVLSLFLCSCFLAFSLYFLVNNSDPGFVTLDALGGCAEDEEIGLVDIEVENCFDMNDVNR